MAEDAPYDVEAGWKRLEGWMAGQGVVETEVESGQTWVPKSGLGPVFEIDFVATLHGREEVGEFVFPLVRYGRSTPETMSAARLREHYELREDGGG